MFTKWHLGRTLATAVLILGTASFAAASEGSGAAQPAAQGGDEFHKHHVALFAGGTRTSGDRDFTLGGDYEFRVGKWVGVMGKADTAFDTPRQVLFGCGVVLHPYERVRVAVLPVVERLSSMTGVHPAHYTRALHTSVSLGMPLNERWVLEPMFGVIFADGYRSTFTGVAIGAGF
jgi:hypothetical protein